MKKLIPLILLLSGCASFPFKITGWGNDSERVQFENGKTGLIVGNPRITCYNKNKFQLADGYFVRIEDKYIVVDEYGKDYVWVNHDVQGDYCMLFEQK